MFSVEQEELVWGTSGLKGPGTLPKWAAPPLLLAMRLGEIRNLEEGAGSGPKAESGVGGGAYQGQE